MSAGRKRDSRRSFVSRHAGGAESDRDAARRALIGWVLDRLFDTAPWIMLALMFIGFAGAVMDVMKFSNGKPWTGLGKVNSGGRDQDRPDAPVPDRPDRRATGAEHPFAFTNSALWMLIVLAAITGVHGDGHAARAGPGRWQVAAEGLVSFVNSMVEASIGPQGRAYLPWVFTAFIFILFANLRRRDAVRGRPGAHPFTVTSQFTVTGVMSIISFAIVLGVGFWKHGLHFFSLFVPQGTPFLLKLLITPVEFISFLVRPFSLGLRPFVAMFAGHILLDVFGNFVVQGLNSGRPRWATASRPLSFSSSSSSTRSSCWSARSRPMFSHC